jgi:hypothetical protein
MSPTAPVRGVRRARIGGIVTGLGITAAVTTVVALLWAAGLIDLSKLRGSKPSTAGLIAVPVAARPVQEYTKLTRDHFWDPKRGELAYVYLAPRAVTPDMLTRLPDVFGRVLNHDKPAGYVFTDSDFFPKGTREGLVAGIPAGKRALRVDASKVEGLYGLRAGDHFDLVATLPIDAGRGGAMPAFNVGGIYGQQLALQARLSNWQKQATVRVIVQNGTLVEPMVTRQIPVFSNTFTQGGITRMRPVQEIVIGVAPEEVVRVTEAIAVEAKISCVPRSGLPDDVINRTPNLQPVTPFTSPGMTGITANSLSEGSGPPFAMVERISGTERQLAAVPRR